MKLKICGMKYPDNLAEVAQLQPDYLGFIFYEKSPRYMADTLSPEVVQLVSASIQRVGVFVNATTEFMQEKATRYGLQALQLHGHEAPEQCYELQQAGYVIIKAISIGREGFTLDQVVPYQPYVDFFLFNTQGKQPGGNGLTFDWNVLKNYAFDTPFFLSGGIGPEEITAIRQLTLPRLYGLDVNSRFETEAGRKDTDKLATFMTRVSVDSET